MLSARAALTDSEWRAHHSAHSHLSLSNQLSPSHRPTSSGRPMSVCWLSTRCAACTQREFNMLAHLSVNATDIIINNSEHGRGNKQMVALDIHRTCSRVGNTTRARLVSMQPSRKLKGSRITMKMNKCELILPEWVQVCHFCLFPLAIKEESGMSVQTVTKQNQMLLLVSHKGYLSNFEEFWNPSHSRQESFVDLQPVFTLASLHLEELFWRTEKCQMWDFSFVKLKNTSKGYLMFVFSVNKHVALGDVFLTLHTHTHTHTVGVAINITQTHSVANKHIYLLLLE